MQRLLMQARSAHVFNHEATMERLRKPLLRKGSLQGQFEDMNAMAFLLNQSVIESALKIAPQCSVFVTIQGSVRTAAQMHA